MSDFLKTCYHCHREYPSCEIRICSVKQKSVCQYCCMKCPKHTIEKIGVGCELIGGKHEKSKLPE